MRSKGCGIWIMLICFIGFSLGVRRPQASRLKDSSVPSLDDLLTRLDDSIHDHNKRLQRGLPPTVHYRTDHPLELEEGPTIIQERDDEWQAATYPEAEDDTSDYVNAAPWTRGPTHSSGLQAQDLQKIRLASDNARWVKDNAKCEIPVKKCIPMVSFSAELGSRKYWPRCALLHRCGEDTGCCNSMENTCAMAESETVELYFYVYEATRAGVQMMTFDNHTKCACQPKSEVELVPVKPVTPNTCKCPKHFNAVMNGSDCTCECSDGKSTCRKYQRGKRYFSGTDIRCISTKECVEPTCEYGPFVLRKRRCTKRRERERYTTPTAK